MLTVVGARPQFIKAAAVSRVLRAKHQEFLLHTGQHYDVEMSEVFFRELGLPPPDRNLEVGSGHHGAQTAAMLTGIEAVAEEEMPDWVLVYGDTNSTLAGAIAGAKLHLKVAHVEAGLRSHDRRMPEEINRVVADHVSDLLLCPSETAVDNLAREGITRGVEMVGDVMLDVFMRQDGEAAPEAEGFVLLTLHRPENVDDPERLRALLTAVAAAGRRVMFPVHPRTRQVIKHAGIALPDSVNAIDPVGYREMVVLERRAGQIVTDSGGVQKEAYFAGRPCITLRETTEWPETVAAGWNILVGHDPSRITSAIRSFRPNGPRPDLYGDGHAAERVVAAMETGSS